MFALNINKPKLLFAAALALGAMAVSAPAEARGFGGMGGFHGGMGGFHGGMGGFHGGMGGFHGGGTARGFGGFGRPIGFAHPGFAGPRFFGHRAFFGRPFFFHHRFADDRRFFFRRHRFVGPLVVGSDGAYDYPYYDSGTYGDECFVVGRRVVNRWGYVAIRHRLVCS